MPLMVYNTLHRHKEEFIPLVPGKIGIYVCGPTVYGHSHIGHAKSYVSFDAIVRYLRFAGNTVLYVQNITDVGHLTDDADQGEDKIQKQSRIDKLQPMQLVEYYTRSYFEDMDALGVQRPDISPRASGHIIEQIELIKKLLELKKAYRANESVYFDVNSDKEYGKLSGRSVEDLSAGARVTILSEKRNPADFALWKSADPSHIMKWPSPWGIGFPGWHVECSAMSTKYLGQPFDIHGGGIENQFPHHECEIAQSECAYDQPFARYWLHNNMVTVNGTKMGKSLGNYVTIKDALKKFRPLDIRFFVLSSHYRSTLDYSEEAVEAASRGLAKLYTTVQALRSILKDAPASAAVAADSESFAAYRSKFIEAMNDDFNTPQAIAVLFDLSKEVNRLLIDPSQADHQTLRKLDEMFTQLGGTVLGIIPDVFDSARQEDSAEDELVTLLIDIRKELRANKLWALSDVVRDRLAALGFTLEDKKDGTTYKRS